MIEEISIYIFENFAKNLGKLVEGIVHKGNNVQVLCANKDEMKSIDTYLWTYSQLSFLPHATTDDPFPHQQPALLTIKIQDGANGARFLLCVDVIPEYEQLGNYEKVMLVGNKVDMQSTIDGSAENDLYQEKLHRLQAHGLKVFLIRQGDDGRWDRRSL